MQGYIKDLPRSNAFMQINMAMTQMLQRIATTMLYTHTIDIDEQIPMLGVALQIRGNDSDGWI